jgi:ribose transport system permease protein
MSNVPLDKNAEKPPKEEQVIVPPKKGAQLEWVRRASVGAGVALLFIIFSVLTSSFYQPANILDILLQSSINTMIAVGMTLVIMTRGIDLSVGSMVGLTSMITASVLPHNLFLGIAAGMLMGIVCGLINGLMIAKLKLPDFIVTLGMLSIYRGAALIYTDGKPSMASTKRFDPSSPANSSAFRHRYSLRWRSLSPRSCS